MKRMFKAIAWSMILVSLVPTSGLALNGGHVTPSGCSLLMQRVMANDSGLRRILLKLEGRRQERARNELEARLFNENIWELLEEVSKVYSSLIPISYLATDDGIKKALVLGKEQLVQAMGVGIDIFTASGEFDAGQIRINNIFYQILDRDSSGKMVLKAGSQTITATITR